VLSRGLHLLSKLNKGESIFCEQAVSEEQRTFEDLGLGMGQQLLLHPDPADKTSVFSCLLVGALPGEALIVTAPPDGVFPRLAEGQKVVVRVFLEDGVALFPTTVLFVGEIPALMVYLDMPAGVQFKRLRAAKRVVVAQPVLVSNLDNPAHAGVAGKLLDVSTGGGRLKMFDELGANGDKIEIKGKFNVHGITRLLNVTACIRKRERDEYGVQFIEQDEDKLIFLMGFIFNAMINGTVDTIR